MTSTDLENTTHPTPTLSHGLLSKQLLLSWEDKEAYMHMINEMQREYAPVGYTESHMVEEIAGIMWRKQRLRAAEAAHYRKELASQTSYTSTPRAALIHTSHNAHNSNISLSDALNHNGVSHNYEMEEITAYITTIEKAIAALESSPDYDKALMLLMDVTREWWRDFWDEESGTTPTAEDLLHFLQHEALPHCTKERDAIASYPLIKAHMEAECMAPSKAYEKFSRYEVHLDRKFERCLTVLLRLQEMRVKQST